MDDILTCLKDPEGALKDIEGAMKNFEKHDMASITMGFMDLSYAFKRIARGIQDCDKEVSAKELEIFNKMLESFSDPKSLAIKAGQNLVLNGVEIYKEMSAAYTNYRVKEFEGFGRDIGVSMALTFIGACNTDHCDEGMRAVREMVKKELYPTGL